MPIVLSEPIPSIKIKNLAAAIRAARAGQGEAVPELPARDIQVLGIRDLPPKKGISFVEGQARLLHDLANIELQAMELGFRTLLEFPHLDSKFLDELESLTLGEGHHLSMCLEELSNMGFPWGTWPVHLALWTATSPEDSILDRLLIVHRYQEGGGLDAGETLLRRVREMKLHNIEKILNVIFSEELGHVQFGSYWYKKFATQEGLNPEEEFVRRLPVLMGRMPRRLEPVSKELRLKAGFTEIEIAAIVETQKKRNGQSGSKENSAGQKEVRSLGLDDKVDSVEFENAMSRGSGVINTLVLQKKN